MKLYQKVCLVLANEGVSGLARRAVRKLLGGISRAEPERDAAAEAVAKAKEEYQRLVVNFLARARSLGYGDLSRYYWYHTIDLGRGLVTPGDYDYRWDLPAFRFPANMQGLTVLDVGSATGFFAFEFERRGAQVLSVELPSIADWDMPSGEDRHQTLERLKRYHGVTTVEDLQHCHLDGPYEFCQKLLGSKVRRCHSTIYDLSPQTLGGAAFDLIFVGDVLLHTFSPLKALASLAPLCRGTLVISQELAPIRDSRPLMLFGGGELARDSRTWWHPNLACLEQMLRRLGFPAVEVVGHHTGIARRQWSVYQRTVLHATKPRPE